MAVLVYLLLLSAFVFPGLHLVVALGPGRNSWSLLVSSAFVLSLGLFSLFAWPSLLWRVPSERFRALLPTYWAIVTLGALQMSRKWSCCQSCLHSETEMAELGAAAHNSTASPWRALGFTAMGITVGAVALLHRPHPNDTYYLSAIRQYAGEGCLNREDPSLPRDGIPVSPVHMLLSWELLGATLCAYSGLEIQQHYYVVLPSFVVILVEVVHWHLCRRLLGRRLAPLAMVCLNLYWVGGVRCDESAGDYVFRLCQGKGALWHVGLPLIGVAIHDYLDHPSVRQWLKCSLLCMGCLGMTSSAVFLLPALMACMLAAHLLAGGYRGWSSYGVLLAGVVCVGPFAATVRLGVSELTGLWPAAPPTWTDQITRAFGATAHLWYVPFMAGAVIIRTSTHFARLYCVWLPMVAAVTALNPMWYHCVASYCTSYHTYYRLAWILPTGPGLASAVALAMDYAAGALQGTRRAVLVAVGAFGLMGILIPILEDPIASDSRRQMSFTFRWRVQPTDLPAVIDQLCSYAENSGGRLLFPEHLSTYFPSRAMEARFVSSAEEYTRTAFARVMLLGEAAERLSLVTEFLQGRMEGGLACQLLGKYDVEAVLLDGGPPSIRKQLSRCGYTRKATTGPYEIWTRRSWPLSRG